MDWQAYRLTFKLKAPLCIGDRYIGNLRKCKHFVPSTTMWGAVTASLTRQLWDHLIGAPSEKYKFVGDELFGKKARFGYFYLVDNNEVLYPIYKSGSGKGLCYGKNDIPVHEFEKTFLHATGMTSIKSRSLSAEENTLHEMEFITHIDRNFQARSITGNLYLSDSLTTDESNWFDLDNTDSPIRLTFNNLSIGGSRSNGFGNVTLAEDPIETEEEVVPSWKINKEAKEPTLIAAENSPILPGYCAIVADENLQYFQGDVTILSSLFHNTEKGSGQEVKGCRLVAMPGSTIQKDERLQLVLKNNNIWEIE